MERVLVRVLKDQGRRLDNAPFDLYQVQMKTIQRRRILVTSASVITCAGTPIQLRSTSGRQNTSTQSKLLIQVTSAVLNTSIAQRIKQISIIFPHSQDFNLTANTLGISYPPRKHYDIFT